MAKSKPRVLTQCVANTYAMQAKLGTPEQDSLTALEQGKEG
jgi:hypothetical protein